MAIPGSMHAVLVGNKISPGNPVRKPDGTVVRTLWGERPRITLRRLHEPENSDVWRLALSWFVHAVTLPFARASTLAVLRQGLLELLFDGQGVGGRARPEFPEPFLFLSMMRALAVARSNNVSLAATSPHRGSVSSGFRNHQMITDSSPNRRGTPLVHYRVPN